MEEEEEEEEEERGARRSAAPPEGQRPGGARGCQASRGGRSPGAQARWGRGSRKGAEGTDDFHQSLPGTNLVTY